MRILIVITLAVLSVLCFGAALGYGMDGAYTDAARLLISCAAMAGTAIVVNNMER
jgi:hypothetical protein